MSDGQSNEQRSLMHIIKEAIRKEYESCEYYQKAASTAVKPACRKMFLKLAEMEKGHAAELMKHLMDLEAQLHIDRAITGSF